MKKKSSAKDASNAPEELSEFEALMRSEQVKPLPKSNKVRFSKQAQPPPTTPPTQRRQQPCYLSDEYQPNLPTTGPMKYAKPGYKTHLKALLKGHYVLNYHVDLHGMTKAQAKDALVMTLTNVLQQYDGEPWAGLQINHGVGKGILKAQIPRWLIQVPEVIAFHEAPKHQGGHGVLWVLLQRHPDEDMGNT